MQNTNNLGIVLGAARELTRLFGAVNAKTIATYAGLEVADTKQAIETLHKQHALTVNEYGDVTGVNPNL